MPFASFSVFFVPSRWEGRARKASTTNPEIGHVELSSSTPAESTEATHKVRSLPTRVHQNHAEHGRPAKGTHNGLEARRGARRD